MWKARKRNLDGIQFEELRKRIDPRFNALHDQLSDCYYNFWEKGLSKPFSVGGRMWDVKPTVAESKVLFDKLHALIFHRRDIVFHEENMKQPANKRYSEEKYRYTRNDLGEIIKDKTQASLDYVEQKRLEGFEVD